MTILNELGYRGVRSGGVGVQPFFSAASYAPGYMSSYEIPTGSPRPSNSWDEATTRSKYQARLATWKANHEWAIIMSHSEAESDSIHVEWMIDEVAADSSVWIATFGEVAAYLDSHFTDVGVPVDSTGRASAWIHGLSPVETTYVVVTAYDSLHQESGWSNEIAILPLSETGVQDAASPATLRRVAYPNPFSTETTFRFLVREPGPVEVDVFDIAGRRVWGQRVHSWPGGWMALPWNGRNSFGDTVPSGVYLYRIQDGGPVKTGKVVLLR